MTFDYATTGLHADDGIEECADVAPPIHVTTTYDYPADLSTVTPGLDDLNGKPIYSRLNQNNVDRVEAVLGEIIGGHAVAYSNGLAAFHAAMFYLNPKVVMVGQGYAGVAAMLSMLQRNYGVKLIDLDDDPTLLNKGDVIHLETPINPSALARDIEKYSAIAKSRGATLVVDSTFAPPPLFDPFKWGADIVMHSGSKYFGGHSDTLSGVLCVKDNSVREKLRLERIALGTILPSLESWTLLRSLRTYNMRIKQQAESSNTIVAYLSQHKSELPLLQDVSHASLQTDEYVKRHLPLGGGPVFQLTTVDRKSAMELPGKLKLFHHCTSLGGVESMIEWRIMTDARVPDTILRVSIGIENTKDILADLVNALGGSL
ncbi:hypothetical protein B9G98_02708 [Wickerhamiella sorbophila]|uniref:Trans-sulfuration enzyme n=1 Tax=Wickerhamiella sorbophila TaxID=45607 RepID=A0A2T0FJB8_9ASCO|nr:hypothetical protein B9G98_02708 [Wickerhamiella sorbophila]PRT55088.1 hypothetical protein B9G98_02708 [Wickerhamiella sorbophila]